MSYKFKVSIMAFILSFTFLFPVGVFFVVNYGFDADARNVDSKFKFLIPKEHDLNILFVDCNNLNNRPVVDVAELIKISAHDNTISLLSIPVNLKTVFKGKIFSLRECFLNGTIDYMKKALEYFFDVTIDRVVQADDMVIKRAINCLGGIKIDKNENLNLNCELPVAGDKKIIGGDCFCEMLKNNPNEAFKLLKFDFFNFNNLDTFFVYFANMFKSNISQYDFDMRKKGFQELVRQKNAKLIEPKLELENERGYSVISKSSKIFCKNAFNKVKFS